MLPVASRAMKFVTPKLLPVSTTTPLFCTAMSATAGLPTTGAVAAKPVPPASASAVAPDTMPPQPGSSGPALPGDAAP